MTRKLASSCALTLAILGFIAFLGCTNSTITAAGKSPSFQKAAISSPQFIVSGATINSTNKIRSGKEISWSVQKAHLASPGNGKTLAIESHNKDDLLELLRVWPIQDVLHDPEGWAKGGVRFEKDPLLTSAPDIRFLFLSWPDLATVCGKDADGCAELGRDPPCIIYLPETIFESLTQPAINHEVGHCLGLDHTEGPNVMNIRSTRNTPTQDDILLLMKALEKIK